jgi:hypothetical protein
MRTKNQFIHVITLKAIGSSKPRYIAQNFKIRNDLTGISIIFLHLKSP